MVVACWILLALIPVVLFFSLTGVPEAGDAPTPQTGVAHRVMLMAHIVVLAIAGVAGNAALYNGLRAVVRPKCPVPALFAAWLALFAIVGCQVSWILRPFVGSPYLEISFLREEAFKSNFFQFVFTDLLPRLLGAGNF